MKHLLSRFGGHGLIMGKGKSSQENLPEDQSLENLLESHAFEMKGFKYLSSYEMMPEFMGAYQNLPKNATKIAEIEHDFIEVIMQYDFTVNTSVYFSQVRYCNVFAIYLKTNFKSVESLLGKIEPSYDWVLTVCAIDKDKAEVQKAMPQILHITLMTLLYEMGIKDTSSDVTPSKTFLGKKINVEKLRTGIDQLKELESREELAEVFPL